MMIIMGKSSPQTVKWSLLPSCHLIAEQWTSPRHIFICPLKLFLYIQSLFINSQLKSIWIRGVLGKKYGIICRLDNTPVRVLLLLLLRHAQGTPRYGSALPRFPWWLSRMMSGICWPSIRDNHHGKRGRADPYFLWRGGGGIGHSSIVDVIKYQSVN